MEDARGTLEASVRVGPAADPASYIAVVHPLGGRSESEPTYVEIDAPMEDARGSDIPGLGPSWASSRPGLLHRRSALGVGPEVLLVAYLDDIYCSSEAFLIQPPYRRTLRVIAKSLVGLEFTSVAKNYTYVPRCFAAEVRAMFPDASIVDDGTPGATHMDQLRHGASRLPAGSRGLLVTHVGNLSTKIHS